MLVASAVLFLVGILIGEKPADMFMTAVAAAVATIPEGLPIVVTITLAVGVARMAQQNAIIRRLPAVETLGSTTVICSDKTGTLTKNEMTVRLVYDGRRIYEVTGSGYEPEGEILEEGRAIRVEADSDLSFLFRIGLLCNESDVYEEEGRYRVDGDPTEAALIVAAMKAGLKPEEERDRYPQLFLIPFESDRGYMASCIAPGTAISSLSKGRRSGSWISVPPAALRPGRRFRKWRTTSPARASGFWAWPTRRFRRSRRRSP